MDKGLLSISPQHPYAHAPSQGERPGGDRRWLDEALAGHNVLIARTLRDALYAWHQPQA